MKKNLLVVWVSSSPFSHKESDVSEITIMKQLHHNILIGSFPTTIGCNHWLCWRKNLKKHLHYSQYWMQTCNFPFTALHLVSINQAKLDRLGFLKAPYPSFSSALHHGHRVVEMRRDRILVEWCFQSFSQTLLDNPWE